MMRRAFLALACAVVLWPVGSAAQQIKYPHANVTLVTSAGPGGGGDVFLRELIKHLGPVMGVNFAVENVTGGSSARAVAHVAKAPADGTMFYATSPLHIQTTFIAKLAPGYTDLDPLAILFLDPQVIYTRADAPWKTLTEAVAHAKANPGAAKWGVGAAASLERVAMVRLARLADVKARIVVHDAGGDTIINVLNGTLDTGAGEIQEVRTQLEAKKVRLLAVLSDKRLPDYPDLPTAKEEGFNLVTRQFRGLAGPKGVPDAVAAAWHAGLKQALESPAYKAQYAKFSLAPILLGREDARKFTAEFANEIEASLKEFGIIK